jgi:hypothetical protein
MEAIYIRLHGPVTNLEISELSPAFKIDSRLCSATYVGRDLGAT